MWITKTKSITANVGKRSHSWWRTVDSSVTEYHYCDILGVGLKPVSLCDTAMHSVAITARGRFNPDTSALHHCTAQTCERSQCGASWHSAGRKVTLTWLRSPQQQCKGKGCHRGEWPPPRAQSNHVSKLMKTLACLIAVLCCPSLSISVICEPHLF